MHKIHSCVLIILSYELLPKTFMTHAKPNAALLPIVTVLCAEMRLSQIPKQRHAGTQPGP